MTIVIFTFTAGCSSYYDPSLTFRKTIDAPDKPMHISGTVKSYDGKYPVIQVNIGLYSGNGKMIARVQTNDNGEYEFRAPRSGIYIVKVFFGAGITKYPFQYRRIFHESVKQYAYTSRKKPDYELNFLVKKFFKIKKAHIKFVQLFKNK